MIATPAPLPTADPPGPAGLPLVGVMPEFFRDPLGFITRSWNTYGDLVRYRYLGPFRGYMAFRPEHVKYVLQDNNHNYRKPPIQMDRFREVVGNGLFTSEGDVWLQQRRTLQPAFHRQRIQGFADTMRSEAEGLADRWAPLAARGEPLDIMPDMRQLVMRIVARSLFGSELGSEITDLGDSVLHVLEWTNRRLFFPIDPLGDLPLPPRRRFEAHLQRIERITRRFIDQRRASTEGQHDLLTMLLEARDPETGQGLSDQELRDQVMTIFLAGTDTTVNLLGWTWYALSRHPECGQRLRDELQSVVGDGPIGVDDLPNLSYLAMTVDEVLRLYPPAWITTRQVVEDDAIDGYRILAGDTIMLSQWITHRHPEFWDNPEGFDPERFTPERAAGRPRFAYFPFGGGPRQCIGNTFALMEAQIVIGTLARRFRLDLEPSVVVTPKPVIGLRPSPGVIVRIRANQ